jgi:hypothetical protein
MKTESERKEELFEYVKSFMVKYDISCSDTCYQTDDVAEAATEFVDKCCEIVGYKTDFEEMIEKLIALHEHPPAGIPVEPSKFFKPIYDKFIEVYDNDCYGDVLEGLRGLSYDELKNIYDQYEEYIQLTQKF